MRARTRRVQANAIGLHFGNQAQWIKQILEPGPHLVHLFLENLDPQRDIIAEQMPQADDRVIRFLGRPEVRDAIFDLQFIDALRLVVAAPAEPQLRFLADCAHQVETWAQLRVRRQVINVGLVVPAQSPFEHRLVGNFPAIREVQRVAAATGFGCRGEAGCLGLIFEHGGQAKVLGCIGVVIVRPRVHSLDTPLHHVRLRRVESPVLAEAELLHFALVEDCSDEFLRIAQ